MALPPANLGFGGHVTTRYRRFRAPRGAFHARRPIAEHVDQFAGPATRLPGPATRFAGTATSFAGTATRLAGPVPRRLRAAIAPI